MGDLGDAAADYFRAVARCDVRAASDLVIRLRDSGASVASITTGVLAPAQLRVGELWESGEWSVADEHAATAVTESALSTLSHATPAGNRSDTRHIAVAGVEGEWHGLPARMAAVQVAATSDVKVTTLGPSLPSAHLRRRLAAGDIDLLALSCTMSTNLIGAARCIQAAHEVGVPVVIGGRALGPDRERARAIGADGWAPDAAAISGPFNALSGGTSDVPQEVLLLDTVDDASIDFTYDRLVGAFPRLADMPSYRHYRAREDLRWMARSTAAALLTHDPSIVEEFLTSSNRYATGVPADVVATSARLLGETLEPLSASGAAMLSLAAATVDDMTLLATHD